MRASQKRFWMSTRSFDVITDDVFERYETVLIPEESILTKSAQQSLHKYLKNNGRIFLLGDSLLQENGHPAIYNVRDSHHSRIRTTIDKYPASRKTSNHTSDTNEFCKGNAPSASERIADE